MASLEIDRLINEISKLPGLGRKSAQRIALYILQNRDVSLLPLVKTLQEANNKTEKRIIHIILRLPQRSPATPNHGDKRLPRNLKAPKAVSIRTESVVVKIYQYVGQYIIQKYYKFPQIPAQIC